MGHQKHNLSMQVTNALTERLAFGQSKHQAKRDGVADDKIFSINTYESYKKHCLYFVEYCKQEHGCKTLAQCRQYATEWLTKQISDGKSAYTVRLEESALAKMYGCKSADFGVETHCGRADITRSRGDAVRDKNFNPERHKDLVSFCRSTGLRRAELEKLTGDRLVQRDGEYYIHLDKRCGTKGGRERLAPVIGNVGLVVSMMRNAGAGRVFPNGINSHADIHGFRADYATALYKQYARPFEVCKASVFYNPSRHKTESAVYWCRGDRKGQWLDKAAMLVASRALGHNRITVVGAHYIR